MIKNDQHAAAIQIRRAAAQRRGYAKAVRRYVQRNYPDRYREVMNQFTVYGYET